MNVNPLTALILSIGGLSMPVFGQGDATVLDSLALSAPKTVVGVRVVEPIVLDGHLSEPAWQSAPATTGFTQRDPIEGAPPSQRSEIRVLYDDHAIYVGARLYDTAPDSIVGRLGRRDSDLDADRFTVYLDPYHDRRSGYYFTVNAGGTLQDGILYNDNWNDAEWDGVWEGRAARDEAGWMVEMRIPYSQLRFHDQAQRVWGINFRREISRSNERSYLAYQPRGESGFVSRFWDLVGLQGIHPRRQIEIIPYVTTRADFDQSARGNPLSDGQDIRLSGGVDMRVGLTSNLSLTATVNPDFGQVEVDPAVINLTDFETFFTEKRPFFIEGYSTFQNFGTGGTNSTWGFNWSNPILFYTRRIGRAPQGSLPDHTFSDVPEGARILGAAKLTGRLGDSWTTGTVHALTAREHAELELDGVRSRLEVEPTTYYGVYRAQKEFQGGRHGLGMLSTITNRFTNADRLRADLSERSLLGGLDGWLSFGPDRKWVIHGWSAGSYVSGSEERLLTLQRSSLRYFQRPDATHLSIDSSSTSLSGFAGRLALNKQHGRVLFNSAIGTVSPGFESNDLGFQTRADVVNGHVMTGYHWPDPGRFSREVVLNGAVFGSWDYQGNRLWSGIWNRAYVEFLNYYYAGYFVALNPSSYSNRLTRGGPLAYNPPGIEAGFFAGSDSRKPLVVNGEMGTYQSRGGRAVYTVVSFEVKPAANVSLSVAPRIRWEMEPAQWVGAFDDPLATETFGRRYVFAELDQRELSASVRLNWTFTPALSLQLYAQPLISTGDYSRYKELVRPKSFDFNVFGRGASTFDEETLIADPDGPGPAPALELPRHAFNVASLRGTAVLRWEYRPGSTLFLVWTQRRSDQIDVPDFRIGPSFDQLWSAPMENVFLLKLTYWLSG